MITITAMDAKKKDPNYMTFLVRNTNFPWKSHGVWWLSQFRRWGMVKEAPHDKGIVNQVLRPELLRDVAKEMSITMPKDDMKKETLFDGVEFDPSKPEEYARNFRSTTSLRGNTMTKRLRSRHEDSSSLGYRRHASHLDDDKHDRGAGPAIAAENLGGE